jgi:hypothetical protein
MLRIFAAGSGAGPILERLVVSVNRTRLPVGLASVDSPATWPPPRCRPADLGRPLDSLPGVGKTIRARLAKLGLRTVRDLLEHAPFRYVSASPISSLFGEGGEVSIEGTVGRVSKRSPRRRMSIVEATVSDDSGQIRRPGSTSRGLPSSSGPACGCAGRLRAPRRCRADARTASSTPSSSPSIQRART